MLFLIYMFSGLSRNVAFEPGPKTLLTVSRCCPNQPIVAEIYPVSILKKYTTHATKPDNIQIKGEEPMLFLFYMFSGLSRDVAFEPGPKTLLTVSRCCRRYSNETSATSPVTYAP